MIRSFFSFWLLCSQRRDPCFSCGLRFFAGWSSSAFFSIFVLLLVSRLSFPFSHAPRPPLPPALHCLFPTPWVPVLSPFPLALVFVPVGLGSDSVPRPLVSPSFVLVLRPLSVGFLLVTGRPRPAQLSPVIVVVLPLSSCRAFWCVGSLSDFPPPIRHEWLGHDLGVVPCFPGAHFSPPLPFFSFLSLVGFSSGSVLRCFVTAPVPRAPFRLACFRPPLRLVPCGSYHYLSGGTGYPHRAVLAAWHRLFLC